MSTSEITPFDSKVPGMTRRRFAGMVAALLGAAAVLPTAAQDGTPEAVASPVASESRVVASPATGQTALPYLFIQTSTQGTWTAVRGQPAAFVLTLSNPARQTIVIRDEPQNAAGTISTALFFDSIRLDTQNPLRAVISAQTATGEDVLIVNLLRATYDPTIGELTYTATRLSDYTDQHGLTPLKQEQANFTLPPSFGATTVFITNAFCRDTGENACSFG